MTRNANSGDQTAWETFYSSTSTRALINGIPPDGIFNKGNSMVYDTADQRISNSLVGGIVDFSFATAKWIVADNGRLNRFVRRYAGSSCNSETVTNTSASSSCLLAFINGFGLHALRRPMQNTNSPTDAGTPRPNAQNDVAFYTSVFSNASSGGFDSLITSFLIAPDLIFITPFKGQLVKGDLLELTSYELAAKLSYYLTDFPPDDQLLSAAQAQFQGATNSFLNQVNRLFSSPKARARLAGFYRQWSRPQLVPNLNSTPEVDGINLTALRRDAIEEILTLAEYYTFSDPNGKAADLVSSDISFAKNPDLADFYGVPAWGGKENDGTFDSQALVRFPSSQPRAGIFTRAAFAYSGGRDSDPILRGARIRRDFLCMDMSPPANLDPDTSIPLTGLPTARNLVTRNTSQSACIGCHFNYINPIGFALENYDAFGRFRTKEPLYDSNNNITQEVVIDARVAPKIRLSDNTITDDGVEFSHHLGESKEFNSCFVRHYYRFSQGRPEDVVSDGCQLNDMYVSLTSTPQGGLQTMIKSVAHSPSFRQRPIKP